MPSSVNFESKPSEGIEGDEIEILESGDYFARGAAGGSTDVVTNPTSARKDSERGFRERRERNDKNERRDFHVEERDGA